jgi:hypothetical protein
MLVHGGLEIQETIMALRKVIRAMAAVAPEYGKILVGEPIKGAGVR